MTTAPEIDSWIAQTQALIVLAQGHYAKAERRMLHEQSVMAALQRTIDALNTALDVYTREKRLPKSAIPALTGASQVRLSSDYHGLKPRDLLRLWADKHDGVVVMNEAVKAAVSAGNFETPRLATGSLYATMSRLAATGEFVKADDVRGVFRRPVQPVEDELPWMNDVPASNGYSTAELEDLPF